MDSLPVDAIAKIKLELLENVFKVYDLERLKSGQVRGIYQALEKASLIKLLIHSTYV
ncbi:MAG: hypothetical protein K8F52_17920 [Candidatus Scalindua rubra]|uniref:Uncharacterized protein n=1 Tax=Candidatus Scalindua brodae TaxID=237368 RepID=A0A0B0EQ97_9BACT|nr:MAG: hypothetical protein SCABRO_00179 [Candidatus Scalindua brodae]MBZ0110534.1 hypothetical protein [Candidatus Scalindua rubra]TWU30774.1 hypothetical protein S225a_24310 [Candidatus Brocadiaceae bacterium S225]